MRVKEAWKEMLIRELERGKPQSHAMAVLGVGRGKLNAELNRDPEFAERMNAAKIRRPLKGMRL